MALLEAGADVEEIAAAASEAAEGALAKAASDQALVYAFWLLTQVPLAAWRENFPEQLRELGFDVGDRPGLWELVGAFSDAVDEHVRRVGGRTDFGEMAQLAATESLTAVVGRSLAGLLGSTAADVRLELARLATAERFGGLARDFFARLTRRHLDYYLSRELSNHVGAGARFRTAAEHSEFNRALDRRCREAARIVAELAGDWYSEANSEGGITPEQAGAFARVAYKETRSELRKRRHAEA